MLKNGTGAVEAMCSDMCFGDKCFGDVHCSDECFGDSCFGKLY